MSAVLFSCEQDKLDYFRDHCKSTAFEVIQARAKFASSNAYKTSDETVADLASMFGEYDLVAKNDALIHSPNFHMGIKNSKETFDEFLARFTTAIDPLSFSEV